MATAKSNVPGRYECPECGRSRGQRGKLFSSWNAVKSHYINEHGGPIPTVTVGGWCEDCDACFVYERDLIGLSRTKCPDCREGVKCPTCDATENSVGKPFTRQGMERHHATVHGESITAGPEMKEGPCGICGESVEYLASESHRSHFCSRECFLEFQSERMKGKNNPRWREAKVIKSSRAVYRYVREFIGDASWRVIQAEEIEDECYMCGTEDDLHLHHIIPIRAGGTNGSWNLMTLCRGCHDTVEARTKDFTEDLYCSNAEDFEAVDGLISPNNGGFERDALAW